MTESLQPTLAPPFALGAAIQKVRKAEDDWNSRNPQQVALGYSVDSRWRNRSDRLFHWPIGRRPDGPSWLK